MTAVDSSGALQLAASHVQAVAGPSRTQCPGPKELHGGGGREQTGARATELQRVFEGGVELRMCDEEGRLTVDCQLPRHEGGGLPAVG